MLNKPKESSLYAHLGENKASISFSGDKIFTISVRCFKFAAVFQKIKKIHRILVSLVDLVLLSYEHRHLDLINK